MNLVADLMVSIASGSVSKPAPKKAAITETKPAKKDGKAVVKDKSEKVKKDKKDKDKKKKKKDKKDKKKKK